MSESFYSDLRKQCEQQQAKIERLTAVLDQRHINDQCILDEAIKAATKVKDAEIERLMRTRQDQAQEIYTLRCQIDALDAEIERLTRLLQMSYPEHMAEIERLRAELAELRRAFHLSALGQEDKR